MSDSSQGDASFAIRSMVFATTQWSVVQQAGGSQSSAATAALERLCQQYWFPLYAFIRRKGYAEEDSKDLTQEFFTRLLVRKDFQTVDARRGKFRTFLLAALTHFLSNERDRAHAAKRGGGRVVISLDELPSELFRRYEPSTDLSPDKLFDQRWAMTLLEGAVARLAAEMSVAGRAGQFDALKKFLTREPDDGEYAALAQRLGCAGQSVGVAVHRLRQRYREIVRAEVVATVSNPAEVDEEMRCLLAALTP